MVWGFTVGNYWWEYASFSHKEVALQRAQFQYFVVLRTYLDVCPLVVSFRLYATHLTRFFFRIDKQIAKFKWFIIET